MVDFIQDRAELARINLRQRKGVDTADPSQHAYDYPWQAPTDVTGFPVIPFAEPLHERFEISTFTLVQNGTGLVTVDRAPQWWYVAARASSHVNIDILINVFLDSAVSGNNNIVLGQGGYCRIPANGHRQLLVQNTGTNSGIVNVIAINDPHAGDILISPGT